MKLFKISYIVIFISFVFILNSFHNITAQIESQSKDKLDAIRTAFSDVDKNCNINYNKFTDNPLITPEIIEKMKELARLQPGGGAEDWCKQGMGWLKIECDINYDKSELCQANNPAIKKFLAENYIDDRDAKYLHSQYEKRLEKISSSDTTIESKTLLSISDELPVVKTSEVFEFTGLNFANIWESQEITPTSSFTLSIWFNSDMDATGKNFFVHKGNNIANEDFNFGVYFTENEQVSGGFKSSSGKIYTITSPNSYNDRKWHQAVLTFNQSSPILNLYMDGKIVASELIDTGIKPDTTGNRMITLGASSLSEDLNVIGGFIGYLDDFKLWETAASEDQVLDLFNAESESVR